MVSELFTVEAQFQGSAATEGIQRSLTALLSSARRSQPCVMLAWLLPIDSEQINVPS